MVAQLRYGTMFELNKQIQQTTSELAEIQKTGKMLNEEVEPEDIANIVSQWTNIPVSRLLEGEKTKLIQMEDRLKNRVVGQDPAISAVANAIRRADQGFKILIVRLACLFSMGPTGVGKTETAKALAEFLFDNDAAMIRIDMSEYMEKFAVSRLIGAPPGYVGYDEGGQLTEAVRRRPYCVILFDEIEKAHPDVFNVLLQIMDEGRLTHGKGKTVDFKNTVLIMTSNIGGQLILESKRQKDLNQEALHNQILGLLKQSFRPEFLNRVDDIVIFNFLGKKQIRQIFEIQIRRLNNNLGDRKLSLTVSDQAENKYLRDGFDPEYGARSAETYNPARTRESARFSNPARAI